VYRWLGFLKLATPGFMQDEEHAEYLAYLKKQSDEDLVDISGSIHRENQPKRYQMVLAEIAERDKSRPVEKPSSGLQSANPDSRLYSPRQIYVAAFIGSPVAACWCLARNYRQLGNPERAQKWLIWGGGGSIVIIVLLCFIPGAQRLPRYIIPIAYSFTFREIAMRIQGDAVAHHISAGGRLASWWLVIGVSLLFFISFFGLLLVILYFATQAGLLQIDAVGIG
jgi:hypothetical protein